MLSDRLVELTRAGLVERRVGAGPPVAVSYALTPNGLAVLPALSAVTGELVRPAVVDEMAGVDGDQPTVAHRADELGDGVLRHVAGRSSGDDERGGG